MPMTDKGKIFWSEKLIIQYNTIHYFKKEQCTDLIQTQVYAIKRGKISLYSMYEGYPFWDSNKDL